ncbi:hypothetical protein BGZ46_006649 [Entomortierella lignicola]|nr:hypothetical protein BGZ46_006649 [Entomortierella lignicola]
MTQTEFDPEDFPIVVAIDFGTTFSPKQNIQYAKTPTLNLYKKVDGKYKMVEWGWTSKLKMESTQASDYIQFYQYKPYLDESLSLTPWSNRSSAPHGISVQVAISDYLKVFHEYVSVEILQQFGRSFSRKSFRYCLTVPAMWSDKAKDVMRKAAIRANIITENDHPDRLMLVSEPEAAALYCERACRQYDIDHGDRFMICDAGGGTVDLIVYEIASTTQGRRLSEVTKGHGASCGSMFIDLNFGNLLVEKFTSQGGALPKNIISTMIETFAYQLKPQFDGVEDQYLSLPRNDCFDDLQDPEAIGIDGGYMLLKASELKEFVFEPVVNKVLALIQQQLDGAKGCSAIFMVGGFGSSKYLLKRVKQEFGGITRTISSPNRPELAVVCGAVYVGLNPKIVSARVTRLCYGTDMLQPFKVGTDPNKLKLRGVDGEWCRSRFSTFVKKGQQVQIDECVTQIYYYTKEDHDSAAYSASVFVIDGQPPRYCTDARVSKVGTVSFPCPFKSKDPIGSKVEIVMKMYFGLNVIKTEVIIKGKKYSIPLKYENGDLFQILNAKSSDKSI